MKYTRRLILVAMLLAASWSAVYAADNSEPQFDLLKAMSVADYRATGLEKLSDAQLKALSAWFANYQSQHGVNCPADTALASPKSSTTVAAGSPKPAGDSSAVITSHISGNFTGWYGGTVFKLDNGQSWQQIDESVMSIAAMRHPEVTISKGMVNTYYLKVKGLMGSVPVRQVEPNDSN